MTKPLPANRDEPVRTWVDRQTGRKVRQLTQSPEGTSTTYFRIPKRTPSGWVMTRSNVAIHPDSGAVRSLNTPPDWYMITLNEQTGTAWFCDPTARRIWKIILPFGEPELWAESPDHLPGAIHNASCDGNFLFLIHNESEPIPPPHTRDSQELWRYFNRKRSGQMWAWDCARSQLIPLRKFDTLAYGHILSSPTRPEWLAFSVDNYEAVGQRIWMIRVDGTDFHAVRPQEKGEWISHEFWMPDGDTLGYKYQDRRQDPELHEIPWAEYAKTPTHFGVSHRDGRELYRSDPLNHYHSHIIVNGDGRILAGEGTDGHPYIYAARLDFSISKVDFIPQAALSTRYVPLAGMHVNAYFSGDGRWLFYNDTVDGHLEICAVEVAFDR